MEEQKVIFIFTKSEAIKAALELDWTYVNITTAPYDEITKAIENI